MPPIPNGHNALTIAYSGNAGHKKILNCVATIT